MGGGGQLNGNIDKAATWPTPPPGFQTNNLSYYVRSADLTLSGSDTYTFTVPKEVFPSNVQLNGGGSSPVGYYKIDITAEAPTGNAAIMVIFQKQ
jgi:hypothetical protein